MTWINNTVHYLILKRRDSTLSSYYRWVGADIGENCSFIGKNISFSSEPYLIHIGNHVRVSFDVAFITHDGGAHVLREKYPNAALYGEIIVGNNVFIGARSIILPNVRIGNNCIIAAGSIVTRSVLDGSVVAGVPARRICSIEEYERKHKNEFKYIADYSYEKKKNALIKQK